MPIQTFPDLIGKTFASVTVTPDREQIIFGTVDGPSFRFWHLPECCESVAVQDVIGDLDDLEGCPILEAEEISSEGHPPPEPAASEYADSYTWTFYRFSTVKGTVTVRWLGQSNGYYSESVTFERVR